ncbi:MAG: hypothetical protein K9H14_00710 [Actinomycetia bacterium]|nr:hypothetical protein [Actinomycetes bacterium]
MGKLRKLTLRNTKINPVDYKILSNYLDPIDEIDKKIKDIDRLKALWLIKAKIQ